MDGLSLNLTAQKLAQLREILPEAFAEDKIDFHRLRTALGEDTFAHGEHYELSWAGKTDARKEIQKQTPATLLRQPPPFGGIESGLGQGEASHIFIEGENLETLRTLQKSYFGKVKMIYIDPPYNTGNDSFVYPDDYTERQDEYKKRTGITNQEGFLNKNDLWKKNTKENGQFHSVWLSMMLPRLYLSRNLLREDGVIFISIDDNEAANLKLLCDEVFGEENFVAQIIWERSFSPVNLKKHFSESHDYILCYARNLNSLECSGLNRKYDESERYKNPDNDIRGDWTSSDMTVGPPVAEKIYAITTPNGNSVFPTNGRCWLFTQDRYQEMLLDNRIWFGEKRGNTPRVKKFLTEVKQGITPMTIWKHTEVGHSQDAAQKLKALFDGKAYFDYPKSVDLLKRMLQLYVDKNSLILDFFAGSGTTAQAVMELNEEDGGNRQFICVQLPEPTDEKSEAHKAGYHTIADITKARIEKVIQKIAKAREGKMDFENKPLPVCVSYRLADSNFKVWQSNVSGTEAIAQQLLDFTQAEKPESTPADMFVELCLKSGLGLNVAHTVENDFYKTEKNLWFCFTAFTLAQKDEIIAATPQKVIYLNSAFATDEDLTNFQLELKEQGIKLTII